jgi:hypothetical protein
MVPAISQQEWWNNKLPSSKGMTDGNNKLLTSRGEMQQGKKQK